MKQVRVGVVGVGGMGGMHMKLISQIENAAITAACDTVKQIADQRAAEYHCKAFYNPDDMFQSGLIDAAVIATPHYSHTTIGIDALKAGLHVLVEKPISVHKADCLRLINAHQNKKQVFAAMFNQRTDPQYAKVKKLIDDGHLGRITRVNWIITNWFRTNAYYNSGGWRATWAGEGGGVLLNQAPHQLDILWWLCGQPDYVRAFCSLGKYHDIEVEDEVTAYLTYPNDATGVFISSTGEAPGSNRLEICGEMGKVIIENNRVTFTRNTTSQKEFCRTSPDRFAAPETWQIDIPVSGHGGQHAEILANFISAIQNGTTLIAPAEQGVHSVELANAMIYSSLIDRGVVLPLDEKAYELKLNEMINNSTRKKQTAADPAGDLDQSF